MNRNYLVFWAEPGKIAYFVGTFNRYGMAEWSRRPEEAAKYTQETAERVCKSLGTGAQTQEIPNGK